MAIEKIQRPKKIQIIDRMRPQTIEALTLQYNTEIDKVYDYLDYLVDYLNSKEV